MNRAFELIEYGSPKYGHKMGYKHGEKDVEEAYECGFEEGYEEAMKEIERGHFGHRYGNRSRRSY